MKVFQCIRGMEMHYYYDRYNLNSGQLVRADDPKLMDFLEKHTNTRRITDDKLISMAPPIQLIKQPEDPYRMRKEDVLQELRSYGIAADPYNFAEKLSMQLQIARKMKKRNFITVMNTQGRPVYVDEITLPTPVSNVNDQKLPEPEVIQGDYILEDGVDEDVLQEQIKERQFDPKEGTANDVPLTRDDRDTAMSLDPIIDEEELKNKGKVNFEDWVGNEYDKQHVDKEKEIAQFLFKEQGPSVEELEKEERSREKGITNEEIIQENFKHLIDTDEKVFCEDEVTQEELDKFRKIKWPTLNLDILDNYLRKRDIRVEYDDSDPGKRWKVVEKLKEIIDETLEKERIYVELNMLQKRHDELTKMEPNYRKFTEISLRRRASELSRYGVNVWYNKDTNIRKHAQKLYALAKLGLDVPDTEEEIDQLLIDHRRKTLIK